MTDPQSLESLERYADTLVSLETFARLLDLPSAALRARRTPDTEFPIPVVTEPRSRFLLGELIVWARSAGVTERVEDRRVAEFALGCAVRRCALAHRSEATNRFVGGVALLVAVGWRPGRVDGHDDHDGLVRRLRTDAAPPWHAPLAPALLARGFEPDPHPAHDPRVRAATIEWRGRSGDPRAPFAIPDDSREAADVVREVLAVHGTRRDADEFALVVDDHILPLLRSREHRTSTTPRLLAATMAALAPVGPGALVCDPAIGEASTVIDLVERTRADGSQTIGITGRELHELAWTVAKIRLGVRGIAHRLGEPGLDSTERGAFDERFDVVVCEPAVRRRNYREWFALCHDLADEDGTAVIAVPAEILGHEFPLGSWWSSEVRHVRTMVLTPRDRRRTRVEAWAVCAVGAHVGDRIDVVIASESTDPTSVREETRRLARREEWRWIGSRHRLLPMNPPQLAAIASRGQRDSLLTDDAIGLELVTVAADPRSVADLVDARLGSWPRRRKPSGDVMYQSSPSSGRVLYSMDESMKWSPVAEVEESDEVTLRALEAVDLLRWLVDPDTDVDALGLDDGIRNALAGKSTDEVRRALKRFAQRLRGTETRGRKPSRSDASDD